MGLVEIVFLVVVSLILLVVVRGVNRSSRSTRLGISPVPRTVDAVTIQRVSELVTANEKVKAIKIFREATGATLKEAKDAVDAWDPRRHMGQPAAAATPQASAADELSIGARAVRSTSGDIHAIKYVREQTGWGLVEAKAYVDRL